MVTDCLSLCNLLREAFCGPERLGVCVCRMFCLALSMYVSSVGNREYLVTSVSGVDGGKNFIRL